MAFPQPRPARPELPRKHVRTIECGQGAVRAVRFNGESRNGARSETGGAAVPIPGAHRADVGGSPPFTRPFSGCPHAVDGNYCLTCGSDKTLKLWNPHKGTVLRSYQGHGYEVLDAAG